MSIYSKEQINELKSKINYFEFYQKFLPDLTHRGKRCFARCCFHNETKPSLSIDTEYGLWRCWGSCNDYGDCFKFYQKYYSVSFDEAVQAIAEMYNYELIISDEEKEKRDYIKSLYNINKIMSDKFQLSLNNNNTAYNYLTKLRGFSPKIISDFKIGCGINKIPIKESLKQLGLLVQNKEGDFYSKFRNDRIVIPIQDEHGNIVSFIGRIYEDNENKAKYMYTENTSIYEKSHCIYGLYQAKKYIKKFNSVIITEGPLDTIKCHQKGIVNAVCLGGLNISETQINILKKYTTNFYICVEDGAMLKLNTEGKSSLDKIYSQIKQYIPYAKIYIIDLRKKNGEKCDPDMYLNEHSRSDFTQLVQNAKIYNEFLINTKIKEMKPKNVEEQNICLNVLVPMLNQISDFFCRRQYIELVANKLSIPENSIYTKIKTYNKRQDKQNIDNIKWDNRPVFAQKILLSTCFASNFDNLQATYLIKNKALEYMEPFYKNIFLDILEPYIKEHTKDGKTDFTKLFEQINYSDTMNETIKKTLMDIYIKVENVEEFSPEDLSELILEQIETLKEWVVPNENQSLNIDDEILDI